jgi:hypothetical protein
MSDDTQIQESPAVADSVCGHTTTNGEWVFVCGLPQGHPRLHEQRVALRDGFSITNWGDDGKAPHATSDPRARA